MSDKDEKDAKAASTPLQESLPYRGGHSGGKRRCIRPLRRNCSSGTKVEDSFHRTWVSFPYDRRVHRAGRIGAPLAPLEGYGFPLALALKVESTA